MDIEEKINWVYSFLNEYWKYLFIPGEEIQDVETDQDTDDDYYSDNDY